MDLTLIQAYGIIGLAIMAYPVSVSVAEDASITNVAMSVLVGAVMAAAWPLVVLKVISGGALR